MNERIQGSAKLAYENLPTHMKRQIDKFLIYNPREILMSRNDVVDAYLVWEGIIGYTDTIIELVRKAFQGYE